MAPNHKTISLLIQGHSPWTKAKSKPDIQMQNGLPEECVAQIRDAGLWAFKGEQTGNLLTRSLTEFDCWAAVSHVIHQPLYCISLFHYAIGQNRLFEITLCLCFARSATLKLINVLESGEPHSHLKSKWMNPCSHKQKRKQSLRLLH